MMNKSCHLPDTLRVQSARIIQSVLCVVLAALALSVALCPASAFALFNEVDDKNSAQQQVGSYGTAIAAADIPDGTYTAGVLTSSYMCNLYNTAQDAATRSDNKGLCTVTANAGSLVATFFLSPAYTHIYLGSGPDAARSTDAEGLDESAYVKGVAVPIGTSGGTNNAYRYSIALTALNSPVPFATYNGGSDGVENGKWYTREVVFTPSEEMLAAIKGETKPAASQESASPSSSAAASQTDVVDDEPVAEEEAASKSSAVPTAPAEPESEPEVVEVITIVEPQVVSGGSNADNASSESATPAPTAPEPASAASGPRAIRITPAAYGATAEGAGEAAAAAAQAEEQRGPSVADILLITVVGAFALGAIIRAGAFALGKRH